MIELNNLPKEAQNEKRPSRFVAALESQIEDPPGGDDKIRDFCIAAKELYKVPASPLRSLISAVREKREEKNMSTEARHLAMLGIRAFQAANLYADSVESPDTEYATRLNSPEDWFQNLQYHLSNNRELLMKYLAEREVITNLSQRYAGISAILQHVYNGQEYSTVDLGSSFHQGGIALKNAGREAAFDTVKDHTPGEHINTLMNKPNNIVTALGVDKMNIEPDKLETEEDKKNYEEMERWLLACAIYPSLVSTNYEALKKQIREHKANENGTPIMQGDLLDVNLPEKILEKLKSQRPKAVTLSSVLYQYDEPQAARIIKAAREIVDPVDGVVIMQDIYELNEAGQPILSNKIGGKYIYQTWITGPLTGNRKLHVFSWSSTRCTEVKPGADFDEYIKLQTNSVPQNYASGQQLNLG